MDYKLPERKENSNKSTYGRVLNIAGSDYMPGAAYLSSVSALKIGCGYCFLCSSERVINAVSSQTQNIVFAPYKNLKNLIREADVIEIGCGLSQSLRAKKLFNDFLRYTDPEKPVIIDADGLNILAKNYKKFIKKGFKKVILTPHPKEAARLLYVDSVVENIEKAAQSISEKYNCVTVLKNYRTVIATKDKITTNFTGNNSMAKAGSGDVLTGMISGLVAQGMDLFKAAVLGVYLHGKCGDIAKEKLTEYSVMAEDLISCIPEAIKNYSNIYQ